MKIQKSISALITLSIILLSLSGEAITPKKDLEKQALNELNSISTSTFAVAEKMMAVQIATLIRIEQNLAQAISKKDEALCLTVKENSEPTSASEACDRMAEAVQNLVDQEFEAAGLGGFENIYKMAFSKALEDVYQVKFKLEEAGTKMSQAYLDYESDLIYLICRASVQEHGASSSVIGSMIVYNAASNMESMKKVSIAQLVKEAQAQVKLAKDLGHYILGKN
jgi:hypothetical protein